VGQTDLRRLILAICRRIAIILQSEEAGGVMTASRRLRPTGGGRNILYLRKGRPLRKRLVVQGRVWRGALERRAAVSRPRHVTVISSQLPVGVLLVRRKRAATGKEKNSKAKGATEAATKAQDR